MKLTLLFAALIALCLLTAPSTEAQSASPDFITVKDVQGVCWKIKPKTFYTASWLKFGQVVTFERVSCQ